MQNRRCNALAPLIWHPVCAGSGLLRRLQGNNGGIRDGHTIAALAMGWLFALSPVPDEPDAAYFPCAGISCRHYRARRCSVHGFVDHRVGWCSGDVPVDRLARPRASAGDRAARAFHQSGQRDRAHLFRTVDYLSAVCSFGWVAESHTPPLSVIAIHVVATHQCQHREIQR